MQVYPGTTNIRPLTIVRRERALSQPGELVVRPGQQVAPIQVIIRSPQPAGYRVLNAGEILGVKPEAVAGHLLVEIGASLNRGTPVLEKKARFGKPKRYASPIDGTLHAIVNGRLVIRRPAKLMELRAMIQGYVAGILGYRGAIIETYGSLIQARWGSGKDAYGKLMMAASTPEATVTPESLSGTMRDKVLVLGRIHSPFLIQAAEDAGVRGLIAGSMPAAVMNSARIATFPVILTEGIGTQRMLTAAFDLLGQSTEREVSLMGASEFAQGQRPEIIIPLPATEDVPSPAGPDTPLQVGQTVRVLREPHAGQVGKVRVLYHHGRRTIAGTRQPGAEVVLENSQNEVLFVPFANLEQLT